jgi:hypothetical protein
MNADSIIAEIRALPNEERSKVFAFVDESRRADDSWIPESFRKAMKDVEAGRFGDIEKILRGDPPPK